MEINLGNRLYKIGDCVYFGTRELEVKEQRGRRFILLKRKQINLKNIPVLPPAENDSVYDYVFGGLFQDYTCYAVDFWIMRYRMKKKITHADFKRLYL